MFLSNDIGRRVISPMGIQVIYEASRCDNATRWTLWHVSKLHLWGPVREYGCLWIEKVSFVVLVARKLSPTRARSLCLGAHFRGVTGITRRVDVASWGERMSSLAHWVSTANLGDYWLIGSKQYSKGIIWWRQKALHGGVQEIGWGRMSQTIYMVFVIVAEVLTKKNILVSQSRMKWGPWSRD